MKQFSLRSILTATLTLLISHAFAQERVTANTVSSSFEAYECIDGNNLIKKMISAKHEFNKKRKSETVLLSELSAPQHILNRNKPTIITFNGLDYLIQNNCVLAVKGLNLSDDVLAQITEKLSFLDQVQFDYNERINMAYVNEENNVQYIRNLDKWYLLTLRILSTTVNDIAALTKKHDASSLAANLIKMPVPNLNAISSPAMAQSTVRLAK
ncbi:hypothetical protein [Pedobacter sp. N23S346]|uniref:hypothetical protein n=1 Tax=Pedobacter sp. N23S346 TaxID=3402750 RepID=UPI003AD7AF30